MATFFGTSVLNLLKNGVNRIFLPIVSYAKQNCGLTCSTGSIPSASPTHENSSYKNNFTSTSPVDVTADDCSVECRSESRDRFIHHNFVQFGKQHSRYKATGRPLFVTAVL